MLVIRQLRIVPPILFLSALSFGQLMDFHRSVSRTLDGMKAQTWTARESAFRAMPDLAEVDETSHTEADQLKVGLIALLVTENSAEADLRRNGTTFATDEHSEYYAALISAVANLHDERAIPALLGAITTGGIAMRGIARLGDKAIDPLTSLVNDAHNANPLARPSALFAIRYVLMMHVPITGASQTTITHTLESALKDHEFGVRYAAISAIEYANDRSNFVPALKDIAAHDPGESTPTQHYTLRRKAEALLAKIASGQQPPDDPISHE